MIVTIECVFDPFNLKRKEPITLARGALARVALIGTLDLLLTCQSLPVVLGRLADTVLAIATSRTLLTILVPFAQRVQLVDGLPLAHATHWTIVQGETVTAIGPVLARIEIGVQLRNH